MNVPVPAAILNAAEELIAKPLVAPAFDEQVRLLNPGLTKRWVNRSTMGGARLAEMQYAGFRPAKPGVDVDVKGCEYLVHNGAIIYMDCILMVISRNVYDAALRYNEQRAVARTKRTEHPRDVQTEFANQTGAIPELTRKVRMYNPGGKDTENMDIP